jgi:hypothetical protein
MSERGAEVCRRFPNGIVEVGWAVTESSVELRGNKAWLPLHKLRVIPPGFEKSRLISFVENERVRQDDRICIDRNLALDRKGRVEGA